MKYNSFSNMIFNIPSEFEFVDSVSNSMKADATFKTVKFTVNTVVAEGKETPNETWDDFEKEFSENAVLLRKAPEGYETTFEFNYFDSKGQLIKGPGSIDSPVIGKDEHLEDERRMDKILLRDNKAESDE